MYSPDSSEILFPTSGSRLLSESPILPSSSSAASTGHGGDDLSISELSLSDRQHLFDKPFSLLAPHDSGPSTPTRGEVQHHQDDLDESDEDSDNVENAEQEKRHASKAREEKLQSDIFILRKLNASFSMFNEALQDTGSANQVCRSFISVCIRLTGDHGYGLSPSAFSALLHSSSKPTRC